MIYKPKCDQVVTQDELKRLTEYRKLASEGQKLNESVRKKLFTGAKVEPGKYRVYVWSYVRIKLTIGSLRQLFGSLGGKIELLFPHCWIHRVDIYPSSRPFEEPHFTLPEEEDVLPKNISAAERQQMRSVLREAVATAFEPNSENHDAT